MTETKTHTPWYAWPFVALWKLVAGIVALTGRLVAALSWDSCFYWRESSSA